jgi:hypothetical protein
VEVDPTFLSTLATKAFVAEAITAATRPLATRDEMHEAIAAAVAPLPTRDEMHAAIAAAVAPLPTRDEMHAAIAAAVVPLATREELQTAIAPLATRAEMYAAIRTEGEQTREQLRRYFDVVAERLEGSIRLVAEGYAVLDQKIDAVRTELKEDIAGLDRRVTRLEGRPRRPRN